MSVDPHHSCPQCLSGQGVAIGVTARLGATVIDYRCHACRHYWTFVRPEAPTLFIGSTHDSPSTPPFSYGESN
jgi:hypothetical protein